MCFIPPNTLQVDFLTKNVNVKRSAAHFCGGFRACIEAKYILNSGVLVTKMPCILNALNTTQRAPRAVCGGGGSMLAP